MLNKLHTEAHIWIAEPAPDEASGLFASLSAAERQRAERLRHPAVRSQFMTGRYLLRTALSNYAPVDPQAWEIGEDALGKPQICGPRAAPRLQFNISHAEDIVACLVTRDINCGLDVEVIDRVVDALRIAEHSFRPEEARLLHRLDSPGRERLFFALWTLKEAYVKARGSGIRMRLDSAGFRLSASGGLEVRLEEEGQRAKEWQFLLYEPTPRHRLAVALDRGSSDPLEVTCWHLDDLEGPQSRPLRLLASTEMD